MLTRAAERLRGLLIAFGAFVTILRALRRGPRDRL